MKKHLYNRTKLNFKMFLFGARRSLKLIQFIFFFFIFWFSIYFYVSTWESDLFRELQRKSLRAVMSKFNQSSSSFLRNREMKIQEYRKLFNLTDPGAMGEAVQLPKKLPDHIKILVDIGWKDYTINEFVSDLVPLRRSLPDIRGDYCKQQVYENLPHASVIIIFHNEAFSMVMRTMHSVLDRSPDNLLAEIILVDDCSDRGEVSTFKFESKLKLSILEHLQQPLEDYIAQFPKVKLLRSPKRNGVMLSRMWGASNAKGPALVFIDCHMEVMPGYLEPLLDRIAKNRNASAIPMIDGLNRETLKFHYNRDVTTYGRHGFAWNMDHTWINLPDYEKKRHSDPWEPFYSVTMLGAMFSIHKDYFKELGMYDPNFDVYGAEDVELSFKVWLCGGVLEQVPCSHAGHMFRAKFFYSVSSKLLF